MAKNDMHVGSNGHSVTVQEMRQYLTFRLEQELFAIPIGNIREIIEFSTITEIPMMPPFLRGVINLRGSVVPVIDLSARFGRAPTSIGKRTCIVIVELEQDEQVHALGIMVDAVNEVLDVEDSQIEAAPNFGAKLRADFIEGMINIAERFVIALNIRQVLSVEEMAELICLVNQEPQGETVG